MDRASDFGSESRGFDSYQGHMKKFCSGCNEIKLLSEFNNSKSKKDGKQNRCRSCTRALIRDHYTRNPKYYAKKAKLRNAKIIAELRVNLREYLEQHPCVDCGETDLRCLTFDHVRGTKVKNISDLIRNHCSWSRILDEIAKCDVRCANCHMKRTAIQFGWWSGNKVL